MSEKLPDWIRVKAPINDEFKKVQRLANVACLETVCQAAACPNIAECWKKHHATFMVMGNVCTRSCRFCNVPTGKPSALDRDEPRKIALAVKQLGLTHAVITSVTRDDLSDGGAQHFAEIITNIHKFCPNTTVEVLIPDLLGKIDALKVVLDAKPDVLNHNIECVRRIHKGIKIGGDYDRSLSVLANAKKLSPTVFTKSGLILGLGETDDEIYATMDDLRAADVDFLTMGQYLRPSSKNPRYVPVDRFVTPAQFEEYKRVGLEKGFLLVASSPLTRSSYHADEDFQKLKKARILSSKSQ